MDSKFYLVVPKLIEQSTWGGDYILKSKNWAKKKNFQQLKIGQSYELFSETKLREDLKSSAEVSFTGELGYAMQPEKTIYKGDKKKLIPLKKLISRDPKSILGRRVLMKQGKELKILIKYTQAKGNSFQIHVREKDSSKKWHFKPESWVYLEKGLLTLGLKKNIEWKKFQSVCLKLETALEALSLRVKTGELSIKKAEEESANLVKKYNPQKYVNHVVAREKDIIDLSCGGLHHSWEEDDKKYPMGNVVYELCYDVMDPISVLRCFDKGKFKEDGSLRKLDVKDYFLFLDKSKKINDPKSHRIKPQIMEKNRHFRVEKLLRTKYYSLDRLVLSGLDYEGNFTALKGSFHHLFLQSGKVVLENSVSKLELTAGHSCFIPASMGSYKVIPQGKGKCELLKTFIA